MKISRNWLSEFITVNNKNIEEELTQIGLEVDKVNKVKNDYVIDIEFTPNRGDCLSALGTSRDLAAFKNKKINLPQTTKIRCHKSNNNIGKIINTVFRIKTAFKPLVSGDPSRIFQDLNT